MIGNTGAAGGTDRLEGEVVAALFFEDERPLCGPSALLDWRLDGALTRMLLDRKVTGKAGEQVVVAGNGKVCADWVLFVGGGRFEGLTQQAYSGLIEHLCQSVRNAGLRRLSLGAPVLAGTGAEGSRALICKALEKHGLRESDCIISLVEMPPDTEN